MSSETEDSHLEPVKRFAARLQRLRTDSGAPSLNDLVRLTREIGKPYTRSTIQAKLVGTSAPDWDFVRAFVAACSRNAGHPYDLSISSWRESHQQMMRELAGQRRGKRRAGNAATRLAVPRQLPGALGTFVGRANELRRLTDLLNERSSAGGTVLINAIGGAAGIGKTALAVYWAHQVADRFPDGQLYVNLRGFDPSGLTLTSGEALRGFLSALQVPAEQISSGVEAQGSMFRSLIAGKRLLIVLDNARDYAQVKPLLPGEPGCLTLVTSRSQSTGLIANEGARPITLGVLSEKEARWLLSSHLSADRVNAEPDAVDDIIEVCAGLPLALAIVAARVVQRPGMPLSVLADQLTRRRRLLDAFEGGDVAIRAAFSWSYDQLGSAAARLFRLLGLHPGPDFTILAAANLAGVDTIKVTRPFAELVRTHLVDENSAGRFTFHDLLRAYAVELAQDGDPEFERNEASRRLFDYYLQSARAADQLINPNRDPIDFELAIDGVIPEALNDLGDAMAWFAAERQVLLAELMQDGDSSFDRHKMQLAWTLADFFERQAHWHDQVATQETAIVIARRLNDKDAEGRAHAALAAAHTRLGSYDDAIENFQQARALYGEIDDLAGQASVDLEITNVLDVRGRHQEALRHAREASRLFGELSHPAGQAYALNATGWCHAMLGDHRAAVDSCRQALVLFDEVGDRYGKAATLDTLGYAYHNLGQYDEAIGSYAQALAAWQDLSDRLHEADTLAHLGDTHRANGNMAAARYSWQQSLAIFDELGRTEVEKIRAKLSELTNAE